MNSRDIARQAIGFGHPPRIALRSKYFSDFSSVCISEWASVVSPFSRRGDPQETERRDGWGCVWASYGGLGQVKKHPLADWASLAAYKFPDFKRKELYAEIPSSVSNRPGAKFVFASLGHGVFERFQALRGFENALMDIAAAEPPALEIIGRIVNAFIDLVRGYAAAGCIDGIALCDDWGTQSATLISRESFRQIFLPVYRRLTDEAHRHGLKVHLHSCGKINDFLDLFVESGFDVLNLQQPRALGIDQLAQYAGRIAFETPVDIQQTLPAADIGAIRAEAELLVKSLAAPRGGFIAGDYGAGEVIGIAEQSRWEAFRAFCEAGNARDVLERIAANSHGEIKK